MAITKILCINETDTGNPARHLEQALEYIQNPDKTNEKVLVGSINCLPETAFEQMLDTKVTFGKTNKRQGYHIIISFVPGEATEEVAFDIIERFANEYLKGEYEAVYAVHNDKNHMHAHLIFNSVNMVTGAKYEYRKGEWERRMQPITNKLCKEYKLDIMPAEYAKEPKNLSRVEWEQEQQFGKMILADAKFCQSYAGSMDHFIFLMKRIGYQFKAGEYLSVKVPGGKWYHQLATLDERFEEARFKYYLDMGFAMPRFISSNPRTLYKQGLSEFQLKHYHKMYRIRMVEQKRFDKNAAWMAKELQRFHMLQDQYLFLVRNDIKSVENLITREVLTERKIAQISQQQKDIYKESGVRKRACKTEADIRDYQMWYVQEQEELDGLKAEKKELKDELKMMKSCKQEYGRYTMLDLVSVEDEVRNTVVVPEYLYAEKCADEEMVEEEHVTVPVNNEVPEETLEETVKLGKMAELDEPVGDSLSVNAEVTLLDDIVEPLEMIADEETIISYSGDAALTSKKVETMTYDKFECMTPEEKAKTMGIAGMLDFEEVYELVRLFLYDMDYDATGKEIMKEAELVYKGMRSNFIVQRAKEIVAIINTMEYPYLGLANKEKAELFRFNLSDNNYNLELHATVLRECGVKLAFDDVYEDYQGIYEKSMEMKEGKTNERGDKGKNRAL